MSIEGQGYFFTIYFPGFVCFVLYQAKISGERFQDHWSSGLCFVLLIRTEYSFSAVIFSILYILKLAIMVFDNCQNYQYMYLLRMKL